MAMNNGDALFHLAALLWRKNKLIRIGINSKRHRPEFIRHYSKSPPSCMSAHAEMDAMLSAEPGDTLYVIRWLKSGQIAMAKPCKYCQQRIKRLKLKVFYTNEKGEWERLALP